MIIEQLVNAKKYVYLATIKCCVMEEVCLKYVGVKCDAVLLNVGNNLRRIRKEKQATQNDIAYYIGSDKSTISSIECNSVSNITLYTLIKLCVVLDVSLNELVSEKH